MTKPNKFSSLLFCSVLLFTSCQTNSKQKGETEKYQDWVKQILVTDKSTINHEIEGSLYRNNSINRVIESFVFEKMM